MNISLFADDGDTVLAKLRRELTVTRLCLYVLGDRLADGDPHVQDLVLRVLEAVDRIDTLVIQRAVAVELAADSARRI